jgi:hypothetical protein
VISDKGTSTAPVAYPEMAMSEDLDLKSNLTDEECDFLGMAFLKFRDLCDENGIDAEKIGLFALIEGANVLMEARGPLPTLAIFKMIAADLIATAKAQQQRSKGNEAARRLNQARRRGSARSRR